MLTALGGQVRDMQMNEIASYCASAARKPRLDFPPRLMPRCRL
jgi:hypothetical protein